MSQRTPSTPDQWRRTALDLVRRASTLTLATAGESGPWSAPVYYLFRDGRFYFFSSPQSRHIREAMAGGAAASLYQEADSWQAIRGIQMAGRLEAVRSPTAALRVIAHYLRRFPFTRDFLPDHPSPTAEAFFSRFDVRLYAFVPEEVLYTDNRFGFASRRRIDGLTKR